MRRMRQRTVGIATAVAALLLGVFAVVSTGFDDRFLYTAGAIVALAIVGVGAMAVRNLAGVTKCPACDRALPAHALASPEQACPHCRVAFRACGQCGYSLVGAEAPQCPECGAPTLRDPRTPGTPPGP